MKIYYAHSISIYATPQEERDLETLKGLGYKVVNPNSAECDFGYKQMGMDYFNELMDGCDAIAFRAHPDGSIAAGVFKEVMYMLRHGKPVIELPNSLLRRGLSVEQTREYLKEVGYR